MRFWQCAVQQELSRHTQSSSCNQQAAPVLLSHIPHHAAAVCLTCNFCYLFLCPQILAFLRVCVNQTLAAFQSHSPASIAGLTHEVQQVYVLRFLKEYVPPAWHDQLVTSYGIDLKAFSEYLLQLAVWQQVRCL